MEDLKRFMEDAMSAYGIDLSSAKSIEDAREMLKTRKKKEEGKCNRTSACLPVTIDEESRSVDATIATETPVIRFDWETGDFVDEVLLMDGCRLDEVPQGEIPLLNSHNWEDIDAQLGSTINLRIEGNVLVGTRVFSSTAEKVFTMVKEGHMKHQSIGYEVRKVVNVEPGTTIEWNGRKLDVSEESPRTVRYVVDWLPLEDSIVSVPADRNCGIRSAENIEEPINEVPQGTSSDTNNNNQTQEVKTMADETNNTNSVNEAEIRAAAVKAAAERASAICNLCEQHAIPAEKRSTYLNSDMDINSVKAAVLDEVAARQAAVPTITRTVDASDKIIAAVTDGLLMRQGVITRSEVPGSNEFRTVGIRDIACAMLESRGESVSRSISNESLFKRAMATGDFPKTLSNVAARSLMQGFDEVNTTYEQWCDLTGRVSDFREQKVGRMLGNFDLSEVKEGEEYTYANMSEDGDSVKVAKYGKKVAYTFEAFINDDLGQLTDIPREFGSASRRLRDEMAYNILIDNPVMRDGKALFHADHSNLAAVSAKPTEESVNAAIVAMATAKDIDGKPVYLDPQTIIVPMSLQASVAKLFNSAVFNDGNAAATQFNTVYGRLKIVGSARLDAAYNATVNAGGFWPWFVVAAPKYAVKFFFLSGYETPSITSKESWDIDGVEIKCRDIVAAKAMTWQGFYKNTGGAL